MQAWKVQRSGMPRSKKRPHARPSVAPVRRTAEDMAKLPAYTLQPDTERGYSRQHRCYFPHTETASTNARPLLVDDADLRPAQLFSHYFAERTHLDPEDFRVAQLDVSNRDLLAPTTLQAQQSARDAYGSLPLVGVRMGGGRRGAFRKRVDQRPDDNRRFIMYSAVREVIARRETDDPLPHCLQAHAAGAGGGAGAGAGAGGGPGASSVFDDPM